MADKEKCKYWDKCYRKDAAHKNQFRHPDNSAGKADSGTSGQNPQDRGNLVEESVIFIEKYKTWTEPEIGSESLRGQRSFQNLNIWISQG